MFVQRKIYDEFLERLVEKTKRMKVGDPMEEDTHVGSMIHKDQAERVLHYVNLAKEEVREHTQHSITRLMAYQ